MNIDPRHRISKNDQVKVDFYSELMNNYFPESTIQAGKDIQSLMIGTDRPLIFYLDMNDHLQAILRSEGTDSGWLKLPLSNGVVKSFEIEFNPEEKSFQIAKVEENKVWVSGQIKLKRTVFEKLDENIHWDTLQPDSSSEQIDKVSIGTDHLIYATSGKGKDAQYYLVELATLEQIPYTLPEQAKTILHFELGNFLFTNGVFLLYKVGQEKSLLYQSFPDPDYNKKTQRRMDCGESINCFALLEGQDGNHIVYAAGKNVHEFEMSSDESEFELTTLPSNAGDIHKIRVAGNGEERSVWTLHDSGLHYRTNKFYDPQTTSYLIGKWTQPLIMDANANQFSCLKGDGVRNQLFSVSTKHGSELTHLWQDGVTTLWNRHKLSVTTADSLKEIESYSVHVRFSSPIAIKTFAQQKVELTSDSHQYIYINSQGYQIGPNHKVSVELGLAPEFTIICPVDDISASQIYINADFLEKEVSINLTEKVLDRLGEKVKNGKDLGKAERPNGKPLVAAGTDTKTLDKAAEAVQQMLNTAKNLGAKRPKATAPMRTEFSINMGQRNVLMAGSGTGISIIQPGITLGDFLNSVWHTAQDVVSFIIETVENGIRVVIKIGKEIFDWVVRTVREIAGYIQKIFEAIAVFFKDLFEFLAFLFDWDAILATKNAFRDFTNEAIISLKSEIGNIRSFIDKALEKEIDKFSPELNQLPSAVSAINMGEPPKENSADPRANWLNSKKDFVSGGEDKPLKERMPSELSDVLEDFVNQAKPIFAQLGEGFLSQVSIIGDAFKEVVQGNMDFTDFLKLLLQKFAGFGLLLVKSIIDLLLSALEALIGAAQVGLNKAWHIPLISDIYREITKGDELTFLDVMCLFIAIPTTVLYKIGEGEAPFGNAKTKEEFVKRGRTAFQLNLN